MLMTSNAEEALEQMLYIYYAIFFKSFKFQVLLNINSKVNIINPVFSNKLGFFI